MDFLRIRQKARERAREREREQSARSAAAPPAPEPEPAPVPEPVAPGVVPVPEPIAPGVVPVSVPIAPVAEPVVAVRAPVVPFAEPVVSVPEPAMADSAVTMAKPVAAGAVSEPPAPVTEPLPPLAAASDPAHLSVELTQLEEALAAELDGLGSTPRGDAPRVEEREPDPLDEFFWREDETAPRLPDLVAASELPMPEPPPIRREWLTFRLGTEEYALQIQHVREVLKPPPLTEVPRAPAHILGVIMVRGEIIAVVDPRARLGLPRAQPGPRSRVLVCDTGEVSCGVLVDAVSSVIRLAPSDVEPRPAGIGAESAEYIAGIGRERNRMYVLLDAPALLGDALAARTAGGLA